MSLSTVSFQLYQVSTTQWDAISTLQLSITNLSSSQATLTSNVSYLSFTTLQLQTGFTNTTASLVSFENTLASTSAYQWTQISQLSYNVKNTTDTVSLLSFQVQSISGLNYTNFGNLNTLSLEIDNLSSTLNTTIASVSDISSRSYTTSTTQWGALTSLSSALYTVSTTHWSAIQSFLPSTTGQSGKYLQATSTGTQWNQIDTGGGYSTAVVTVSNYVALSTDSVILMTDTNALLSVTLPSSVNDGKTFVIKKPVSTSAVVYVTASGGTLLDGNAGISVYAPLGWLALTYSNKTSSYIVTGQYLVEGGVPSKVPFTFARVSYGLSGSGALSFSLSGTSLSSTAGVTINGVSATFTIVNQSQLSVVIPATSQPGVGNVAVYNTSGISQSLVSYFEYVPYFNLSTTGTANPRCGTYTTIADNGTLYYFTDYINGNLIKMTDYGTGAIEGLSLNDPVNSTSNWSIKYGRPVCDRLSGGTVLVPIKGGNYWYSTDAGNTWLSSTISLNANMFTVSPNGSYVLAGTNGQGIYYGTNVMSGDISFTQSPSYTSLSVKDMGVDDAGNCLAVVSGVSLYRSADGGATWSQPVDSPVQSWTACAVANGGYMYVCARYGSVYRSADYGATWTLVTNTSGRLWNAIACDQSGKYVIAATNMMEFVVSYDYGVTFKQRNTSGIMRGAPPVLAIATDANYFIAPSGSVAIEGMRSNFTG